MSETSTEIFGLFDGMTSLLGMILVLAVFGSLQGVLLASVAAAVGAAASMGSGQWLADPASRIRPAMIMAAATLIGSALPAVPFYLSDRWPAFAACGLIVLAIGCLIAHLRPGPSRETFPQTFLILLFATGLAFAAGALVS